MGAVYIVFMPVTYYSAMLHHPAVKILILNPLPSDSNKCHPFKILVVFVTTGVYFYDPIIFFHWYATTEEV